MTKRPVHAERRWRLAGVFAWDKVDLDANMLYPARALRGAAGCRAARQEDTNHVPDALQRSSQDQPHEDEALPREDEGEESGSP